MAISERLKTLLHTSKVPYTVTKHPVVYTAQEIAAAEHVPGRQLAKSVLVKSDHGVVLAVLPASALIDFKKLRALLGAKRLTIAQEADIKQHFPDVEVGAMSPFGNLYHIPVVADHMLGESETIVFNAGSHTETVKMRYRDFAALVKPTVGVFGQPIGGPPARRKTAASKTARSKGARAKTVARGRAKTPSRTRKTSKRPR